jgi:LPXTG-motif cell wall-anchored protein
VTDGGTITWTNTSGVQHTVTRCTTAICGGTGPGTGTDASFTNGTIGAAMNATFSHTFHGAGTYNYYCSIHGFAVMHGVVTVVAATPSTTSPPSTTAPPPTAVAPQGNTATPPTAPTMSTSSPGSGVAAAQTGSNLPRTGTNTGAALAAALLCVIIGSFVLLATRRRRFEH